MSTPDSCGWSGAEEVPFLDVRAAGDELRAELDAAYRRVMDSGRYVLGPEVEAFEQEFAAACGARQCVAVGSGLDALLLMLKAAGVGPGDEVLVPAWTFVATWLAVTHTGARPVPVEPDESTFNLDPRRLAAACTRRTRAILAVHLYGLPAEMDALRRFAESRGLLLFEDAAQAHGARYHGHRTGALADAAAFSFYPSKNLGAFGDAGAVVTSDEPLAERVRCLRNYGQSEKHVTLEAGHNSRLDPLQAAFLRVRLARLDEWNRRRSAAAAFYLGGLAGKPALLLPAVPPGLEPAWHLFVVRHAERDRLAQRLALRGIRTGLHYPVPPHLSPAYAGAGRGRGSLPVAEALAASVLSLPMGPHLSAEHTQRVVEALLELA
jgi:dTDP-3-amino-3,4,6-trideoxy-alpha-D-glucose transaminase